MNDEKTLGEMLYETHLKYNDPKIYNWKRLHPESKKRWERTTIAFKALLTGEPEMEVVAAVEEQGAPASKEGSS